MNAIQNTRKRNSKLDKTWSLYDSYNVVRVTDQLINEIQQRGFIIVSSTNYV
jgi:hypothetical protein